MNSSRSKFQWLPGEGPDLEALSRLMANGPLPDKAMGEAWFMGDDRRIFAYFAEAHANDQSVELVQECLQEIAGGLTCHGHLDDWEAWYRYLLPRWIPRAFDYHLEYVVEYLITAFMAVLPDPAMPGGYASFKDDTLKTLGKAIMSPKLWPEGADSSTGCLHRELQWASGYPIWAQASGDFSASMFLCLKYLDPDDIPAWTRSVFDIPCPRWRAQVLVWLCGAKEFIDGTALQPSDMVERREPKVDWAWCHWINGKNMAYGGGMEPIGFLSEANRTLFKETVLRLLDEELIAVWLESLIEFEPIFDQLTACAIPERLRSLYELQ